MNPMADIWILFASYFISVISLGIALYCMVRVTELTELLERTRKSQSVVYKPNTVSKPKKNHYWK